MRGSFQNTAPGKNTVKHRDGSVGLMVANHRDGGESSVVVTTPVHSECLNIEFEYLNCFLDCEICMFCMRCSCYLRCCFNKYDIIVLLHLAGSCC